MTDEPAFLNLVRVLPAASQRDEEIRVLTLELYEDGVIVRWVLPGGLESAQPGPAREHPERLHSLTSLTLSDDLGTKYEETLFSGSSWGSQGISMFVPTIPADAGWVEVFTRGGVTRFKLRG